MRLSAAAMQTRGVSSLEKGFSGNHYLISTIFVLGIFAAIWLVNLAAKPIANLLAYAACVARDESAAADSVVLVRDDEVGQLARLFQYVSGTGEIPGPGTSSPTARA